MSESVSFLSFDYPADAPRPKVYSHGLDGSLTEILPDGTAGETIPGPKVPKPRRVTGPPALLRRLRNAQRALKRARTAERRASRRVYAAMAALDAANGKRDPVTGTYSYKVTFETEPIETPELYSDIAPGMVLR